MSYIKPESIDVIRDMSKQNKDYWLNALIEKCNEEIMMVASRGSTYCTISVSTFSQENIQKVAEIFTKAGYNVSILNTLSDIRFQISW